MNGSNPLKIRNICPRFYDEMTEIFLRKIRDRRTSSSTKKACKQWKTMKTNVVKGHCPLFSTVNAFTIISSNFLFFGARV